MQRSVLDEIVAQGLRIAVEWVAPPDTGMPPEKHRCGSPEVKLAFVLSKPA